MGRAESPDKPVTGNLSYVKASVKGLLNNLLQYWDLKGDLRLGLPENVCGAEAEKLHSARKPVCISLILTEGLVAVTLPFSSLQPVLKLTLAGRVGFGVSCTTENPLGFQQSQRRPCGRVVLVCIVSESIHRWNVWEVVMWSGATWPRPVTWWKEVQTGNVDQCLPSMCEARLWLPSLALKKEKGEREGRDGTGEKKG